MPLDVPVYCVWGANTGVGKTLASVGLAAAAARAQVGVAQAQTLALPSGVVDRQRLGDC